jgi:hypothetical protein
VLPPCGGACRFVLEPGFVAAVASCVSWALELREKVLEAPANRFAVAIGLIAVRLKLNWALSGFMHGL